MARNAFVWLMIAVAIVLALGGASLIVGNNPAPTGASPPGAFIH